MRDEPVDLWRGGLTLKKSQSRKFGENFSDFFPKKYSEQNRVKNVKD